jgi:glycosyltransferase involved in cell wall biosynthesis
VFRDKLFEMYSFYEAVKSDRVIVPSQYAKTMFPEALQPNVVAQMDGMDIVAEPPPPRPPSDTFRIGFLARDLSSAKGVEHFVMAAKEIHRLRPHCRFVIVGQKEVRYSYETDFLKALGLPEETRFLDYLFQREGIDLSDGVFEHIEFMSYEEYVGLVQGLDLVHYPLQFGSANWGLFECLFRGKKMIASNRCFVPEVITDGYNGILRDYGDMEGWVSATLAIVDDPAAYDYMAENARLDAHRRFHVTTVAHQYLEILEDVVAAYQKAEIAAEVERLARAASSPAPAWMLPDTPPAGEQDAGNPTL